MKELFMKYWNECYLATCDEYPKSIFHIHDQQVLRQKKLHRILNKGKIKIPDRYYRDVKDKIVFEQDYKNNNFWVNYWTLWRIFETKFNLNDEQIVSNISGYLRCINFKFEILSVKRIRGILLFDKNSEPKYTSLNPNSCMSSDTNNYNRFCLNNDNFPSENFDENTIFQIVSIF